MNRNYSLDSLRSIAALLVVILHIASGYVLNGIYTNNFGTDFVIANYINSFTRICVPLFVLLSGRFIIEKEVPLKEAYSNLIKRIIKPLLFWNIFYFAYTLLANRYFNGTFNLSATLSYATNGQCFYHLWYLTMSVGLYLIAPFLQRFLKDKSPLQIGLITAMFLFIGMGIDFAENKYSFKLFFAFNFVKYIGYLIAGYALIHVRKINRNLLLSTFTLMSIAIAKVSAITVLHYGNLYAYDYLSPFVVIAAVSIYTLFIQQEWKENLLSKIAPYTFALYLIHALPLDIINRYLRLYPSAMMNNVLTGFILKLLAVLVLSIPIIWVFKKSKYLKELC